MDIGFQNSLATKDTRTFMKSKIKHAIQQIYEANIIQFTS